METLHRIREAVKERPGQLATLRAEGEVVVGYFCCYIPEEIILALGLTPIRLGRGGDEALADLGARYVSINNCGFIRESVGLFAAGKDPYISNSEIVAVAGTCIQMYRLSELVKHYFQPKTVALGVPRNFYYEEGRDYFRAELEAFTRKLEELSGRKLQPGLLQESVRLCKAIREALASVYDSQASDCPSLKWEDVLEVIQAGFYLDRRQYLSLLKRLLSELQGHCAEEGPDKRPRLMLSGSIIAPGDQKIVRLIEELGGRVIADDLCTGSRFFKGLVVDEPSVASIADAYLNRIPCGSLPCLLPMDEDRRFLNMIETARRYRVEGVIYHTLRHCDPFTFKASATKKFLKEKLQLPFLELHTEYSTSDVEAIRTRIESFLDMVRDVKSEKEAAAC